MTPQDSGEMSETLQNVLDRHRVHSVVLDALIFKEDLSLLSNAIHIYKEIIKKEIKGHNAVRQY